MKIFHENLSYPANIHVITKKFRDFSFMAHWHSDVELIYICDGRIQIGINAESKILSKGDFAICCSGDIHYYNSQDMTSNIYIIIFDPELIGCSGNWPKNSRFLSPFVDFSFISQLTEDMPNISKIVENLVKIILYEMETKAPCYEQFVTGKIYELCAVLQRYIPFAPIDMNKSKKQTSNIRIMQEILQYLHCNYMNEITLTGISKQFSLNPNYFCRIFKSTTGTNFVTYLNRLRAQHARTMLENKENSITDIAYECGFDSIRTFNRVFKKVYNHSPSKLIK